MKHSSQCQTGTTCYSIYIYIYTHTEIMNTYTKNIFFNYMLKDDSDFKYEMKSRLGFLMQA
jgi:hypothetical protein